MWVFIIIVITAVIGKFAYDSNQQRLKVTKEGGMVNKYSSLAAYILYGDPQVKITKQTSTSVDFCLSNAGSVTVFFLTQTFGSITIQWKMNSPVLGNHKLEWDFPEYLDQDKMIARIDNDLKKYQHNVMAVQGFPRSLSI